MSEVYTLGPVFLNDGATGTLLDQVMELGYNDGVQRMLQAADGGADPTWSAISAQNPSLSFATTDLAEALALNSAKFLFKGLELSASNIGEFYYQQAKYADALEYVSLELMDQTSLRRRPDLRQVMALRESPQQWISLTDAAFMVPGLDGAEAAKERPERERYLRNVYETCSEPFVDSEGNVYVMRTVATRPNRAT